MEKISPPYITVRRFIYEEPHHTQLEFAASNGLFSGTTDIYIAIEEIAQIGDALARFPAKVPDEFIYRHGSEKPADNFYRYFHIRAYTTDATGRCAIQFSMNQNRGEPNEGVCIFSILAEPSAINRLGELLKMFSKCENTVLIWNLKGGELR